MDGKLPAVIALDTETTGLYPYQGDSPFMISRFREDGDGEVVDLRDYDEKRWLAIRGEIESNVPKVFHNAKFDTAMLEQICPAGGEIHDTIVMAHLIDNTSVLNLGALAKRYLNDNSEYKTGPKDWIKQNTFRGQAKPGWENVPYEVIAPYALKDVENTMLLYHLFKEQIEQEYYTLYRNTMALIPFIRNSEAIGIKVDLEKLASFAGECEFKKDAVMTKIEDEGFPINPNSGKQIANVLFNHLGLACIAKTEKGNPILDKHTLPQYKHPFVDLLLEWRKIDDQLGFCKEITGFLDSENAVHCNYNLTGEVTARIACSEPNLQGMPRKGEIRKIFIPRPEYLFLMADYSQVEVRFLAHYCQSPTLVNGIRAGQDFHAITSQELFGSTTDEDRDRAKRTNFGIIYGMGAKKFADKLKMEVSECKEFLGYYFHKFPEILEFRNEITKTLASRGYLTNAYGRKYWIDPQDSYIGVNYLCQGGSADLFRKKMLDVYRFLAGKKSRILLNIHDELVFEIHYDEVELVDPIIALMEDHTNFSVPITCDASYSTKSWGEKNRWIPGSRLEHIVTRP